MASASSSSSEDDVGKRDVREPILFECAWEVANKGLPYLQINNYFILLFYPSRRYLHRHQNQSARHRLRIRRQVPPHRALILQDRTHGGRVAGANRSCGQVHTRQHAQAGH